MCAWMICYHVLLHVKWAFSSVIRLAMATILNGHPVDSNRKGSNKKQLKPKQGPRPPARQSFKRKVRTQLNSIKTALPVCAFQEMAAPYKWHRVITAAAWRFWSPKAPTGTEEMSKKASKPLHCRGTLAQLVQQLGQQRGLVERGPVPPSMVRYGPRQSCGTFHVCALALHVTILCVLDPTAR